MSQTAREPIALHGLRFDVAAMSEQGPRSENQDAYAVDQFPSTGVLALADGMGGERSGRVAADTALRTVLSVGPVQSMDDARRAVRQADLAVARTAEEDPAQHGGMGCALGFISLVSGGDGTGWIGAHVGDVRILSRAPDGTVRLETRDHTPAFARWEAGEISLDEIPDTVGANRLQRAVGRGGEADVAWLPARPGWSWLLISDGVYKVMRLDELGRLMEAPSAAAAVEAIRRKVEERGPEDNFTAVLVRALGGGSPAPAALPEETLIMDRSAPPPRPARSGGATAAVVLAILALLAAGAALWLGWQSHERMAERTQVERLQSEVDSLNMRVGRLTEPFGPSAAPVPVAPRGDSAAAPTDTTARRGATR